MGKEVRRFEEEWCGGGDGVVCTECWSGGRKTMEGDDFDWLLVKCLKNQASLMFFHTLKIIIFIIIISQYKYLELKKNLV